MSGSSSSVAALNTQATKDSNLFLNIGYSTTSCKLHPVVVLSILDHFARRTEGQERVIGTLLGVNNDGVVEIRNCFPVPHTETDQPALDRDFHRNMYELHLKANPQERVVGWYSTGGTINQNSVLFHNFYWSEMQAPPLHLTVDTGLNNDKMNINAYISSSLSFSAGQEASLGFQFKPVQLDFEAQKSEQIGLDFLTKASQNKREGTLLQELDTLELSLQRLISLLDTVSEYVQGVLSGTESADPEIARLLADTLSSLPSLDSAAFTKVFNQSLKDLLMVVYLANLTRTQLTISEKLQSLH
ncbi:Eukaryotic translation initiation factor 3 subunit F [Balamuthia mandrillaris]